MFTVRNWLRYLVYFSDTFKKAIKRLNDLKTEILGFSTEKLKCLLVIQQNVQVEQYKKRTFEEVMDDPKLIEESNDGNL